ncbi:MAG: AAA family ATPase [Deltaproteobacteria bacterium]|jgi:hypothetical protein|nr:AAA family ATPase [Deltaproteobacteria bacterium]
MGEIFQVSDRHETFEEFISKDIVYVDKTKYLAFLVESDNRAHFLARPRLYGKSLTISTLKALFAGKKDLFRGLYIEKRLRKPVYAPRPVIHLDMGSLDMSLGSREFENNLRDKIVEVALEHDIQLFGGTSSSYLLQQLLVSCVRKYNGQVAFLIDDYDYPVRELLSHPDTIDYAEEVRQRLRKFYKKLKFCDKFISFLFMTGVTGIAYSHMNSAFDRHTDITFRRKYGGITGFTLSEIERYYAYRIWEITKSRKITREQLIAEMKEGDDGWSFDSRTYVYNPYCVRRFFEHQLILV